MNHVYQGWEGHLWIQSYTCAYDVQQKMPNANGLLSWLFEYIHKSIKNIPHHFFLPSHRYQQYKLDVLWIFLFAGIVENLLNPFLYSLLHWLLQKSLKSHSLSKVFFSFCLNANDNFRLVSFHILLPFLFVSIWDKIFFSLLLFFSSCGLSGRSNENERTWVHVIANMKAIPPPTLQYCSLFFSYLSIYLHIIRPKNRMTFCLSFFLLCVKSSLHLSLERLYVEYNLPSDVIMVSMIINDMLSDNMKKKVKRLRIT